MIQQFRWLIAKRKWYFATPTCTSLHYYVMNICSGRGREIMSTSKDIISNAVSIFQWYSKKKTPKFYGVKIDDNNQHSLSFALGLSRIELETLLKILGLAYMQGDKVTVCNEEKWRSHPTIGKFLSGDNAINFTKNTNVGAKNKMIFIQLGIPSKKKKASQIRMYDSVPYKNNCNLVKLRAKLKNSIQCYKRVFGRQEPIQIMSPSLMGVEVETETSVAAISPEKVFSLNTRSWDKEMMQRKF